MFRKRSQEREIMDDLEVSGEMVDQTLREIENVNTWLGGNAVVLKGLDLLDKKLGLRAKHTAENPLHIADLGCGGGDLLRAVWDWGKRKNIPLKLTGIDANPHIVAFAEGESKHYPAIEYLSEDIFSEAFAQRKFDLFTCSLFLHHFENDALVRLFKQLQSQAPYGFIINDLHRHPLAYYSIKLIAELFSKSKMFRYDAPLSVLRAFRKNELEDLLKAAGITRFDIRWKWAFRWLVLTA